MTKQGKDNPVEDPVPRETAVPKASPEDNAKEEAKKSTSPPRRTIYLAGGLLLLVIAALCIALPLALIDDDDDSSDVDANMVRNSNGVKFTKSDEIPLFSKDITTPYATTADFETAVTVALTTQAQNIIARKVEEQKYYYGREQDMTGAMDGDDAGSPEPPMAMAENESAMTADTSAGGNGEDGGVTDYETLRQEENVDEADIIKADANFVYAAYGDYIIVWDTAGKQVAQVAMPPIDLPENWGEPWYEEVEKMDEEAMPMPADTVTTTASAGASTPSSTTKQAETDGDSGGGMDEDISDMGDAEMISMPAPDIWIPKPSINSMLLTDSHLIAIVNGYQNDYRWGPYDPAIEATRPVLYAYQATQIRLYEKSASGDLTFVGKKDVNGNYIDARSIGDVVHLATGSGVDTWTHLWSPLDRWNFPEDISDDEYILQATELATDTIIPAMARKLTEELQVGGGDGLPNMLQINQWTTHLTESTNTSETDHVIPFDEYDVLSNLGQITSFNVNSALVSNDGEPELDVFASAYMAPSYFDTLYGTEDHLVLATRGWDWDEANRESTQTTYLVALEINSNSASTQFLSVGILNGHLLNSYALDIVGNELRAATTVERNRWWWGGPVMMVDDMAMGMVAESAAVAAETAQVEVDPAELEPSDQCVEPSGDDDCITQETYEHCLVLANAGCRVIIQSLNCPPTYSCADDGAGLCPIPEEDPSCINSNNYRECLTLVRSNCIDISTMESCPLQFDCNEFGEEPDEPIWSPPPEPEGSRTENYMSVLLLAGGETAGVMEKKGEVQIGEPNERITAVRFFDNVAYAVTFERTDPFYVLDMSIPAVLGELKLPGFSSYLHSMNAENTLLLAVGQDADEDGRTLGLMVTVFSAENPANPVALTSYTFEQSQDASSSSNVEWDYKSFRYVDGKLVIPVDIYYHRQWNWITQELEPLPDGAEDFQGFAVLDISTESISEAYRISHTHQRGVCRYCNGYLPTRSFVYSGDLMTVRDNVVVSTGLHSGIQKWNFTIAVEGEAMDCCW